MIRLLSVFIAVLSLIGCSSVAQTGHMREAVHMFNECNFEDSIAAANEAISFGHADTDALIISVGVKAKSLEILGQEEKAEENYQLLVEMSPVISSVTEAKNVARNFEILSEDCR